MSTHLLPERTGSQAAPEIVERRALATTYMAGLPHQQGVVVDEVDTGSVVIARARPEGAPARPALLYFHGGGYRLGSATAMSSYNSHLAGMCGVTVLSVDYRLAPEHPFPAALNDATTAYEWALTSGIAPTSLVVGGDSAGGGLATALLLRLAAAGLPEPAAAVLFSPWLDLRNTAASFVECAATDQLFSRAAADEAARAYLAGHPADDPLTSPLLGDWSGQPPLLLQASDSEVLRDDSVRLAEKVRSVGGRADLSLYRGVPHVWQLGLPHVESAARAVHEVSDFLVEVLSTHEGKAGQR
jgi:acetyl esterase/lipase